MSSDQIDKICLYTLLNSKEAICRAMVNMLLLQAIDNEFYCEPIPD